MNPEEENYPEPKSPTAHSDAHKTVDATSSSSPQSLFVDVGFSESPTFSHAETIMGNPLSPSFNLRDFKSEPIENVNLGVPRPLECLQSIPVPPFLMKTYELVEYRELDPIISWAPSGHSFVVWDPLEFSRIVLPRHFKHNNFSSFVRQLNTYGFRKIDTDRWEFANEAFQRGKKHLLKNIQRRRSPQSQQVGSYFGASYETARPGLDFEVEKLRKDRTMLMREVVELQQKQRGTAQHAQAVNQRLCSAEQRQKQMVSFLAKLLQNPSFITRLKEKKEQRDIGSSRVRRKFLKHGQSEGGEADPLVEGNIIKYGHDRENPDVSSWFPLVNHVRGDSPERLPEDWIGMNLGSENFPSQIDDVRAREPAVSHDLASTGGYFQDQQPFGEGTSSFRAHDPKGKSVIMSPVHEIAPDYFVSFPEDLAGKKNLTKPSSGLESIVKQEEIWGMGFDVSAGMSCSTGDPWGNIASSDELEMGIMAGLSDLWDLEPTQAYGGSDFGKWASEEDTTVKPEYQAGPQKDSISRKTDP